MKQFKGFLKGVNLGGWISQFAKYDPEHFASFITEKDIAYIAGLGFDHVRVPVDYNVLETEEGEIIESGFGYLQSCYEWCRKYGLNMLIDLHECYGYSFDPLKVDMDRRRFFRDEALQERFLKLWREIARRFGRYSDSVAFEPLNEVVPFDVVELWNDVIDKYVASVRELAPDTYIVVGGVNYTHVLSVPQLRRPADDKVVLNFHCYEPIIFTHQGAYWMQAMPRDFRTGYPMPIEEYRRLSIEVLNDTTGAVFSKDASEMGPAFFESIFAPAIETAERYDAALYCGEYGVIDLAAGEDKLRWLVDIHKAFENHGIGHALWNYKEKDFGLVDKKFEEIREKFIKVL